MAFYIYTGKLGGGKSLCAVGRIREKLKQGCVVATNLDLNMLALTRTQNKTARVIRVPDKPTVFDLKAIGIGNTTYDESKNGLLVLDECGTWFNSRNWQDKTRKEVNDWFLHARKLGWDVILIIQSVTILDSQAREALAEMTAFCSRMDRISMPFIGTLIKLIFDTKLPLPRVHVAKVVYGTSVTDLLSDRFVYRGTDLFKCYDTKQAFLDSYPHGAYSMLTSWHVRGRYLKPQDWRYYMKATRIYWKRFNRPMVAGIAALAASAMTYAYTYTMPKMVYSDNPEQVQDLEVETFQQQLDGYYYAGRNSVNKYTTYYFVHPSKPALTSESFMLKGAAYHETSYCVIEVMKGKEVAVLQCNDKDSLVM